MSLALQLEAMFAEEKRLLQHLDRAEKRIKALSFQYAESKGWCVRPRREDLERAVAADANKERGEITPMEYAIAHGGKCFDT